MATVCSWSLYRSCRAAGSVVCGRWLIKLHVPCTPDLLHSRVYSKARAVTLTYKDVLLAGVRETRPNEPGL